MLDALANFADALCESGINERPESGPRKNAASRITPGLRTASDGLPMLGDQMMTGR
jgi:hypothetical protein